MIGQKGNTTIKVSVYLQGCLLSNGCSASRSHRRYPNSYTRLKLIDRVPLRIFRNFPENDLSKFSPKSKLEAIHHFFKVPLQHDFYIFGILDFFSRDQTLKHLKKRVGVFLCLIAFKLQNIFITRTRNEIVFYYITLAFMLSS